MTVEVVCKPKDVVSSGNELRNNEKKVQYARYLGSEPDG